MYPIYGTFHCLATKNVPSQVFARLWPDTLQLLAGDAAYIGRVCDKRVQGATKHVPDSLLSLLLTSPSTRAKLDVASSEATVINENSPMALHLDYTDASSLTLQLSLPITPTPASPILADLHSSLLTAVTALEGVLLALNPDEGGIQTMAGESGLSKTVMSLGTLLTLHAPTKPTGEPLEKLPSFRRTAGSEEAFIASRAFAIAAQASTIRKDILLRRQERLDEERKRRRFEHRVAREAAKHRIINPIMPTKLIGAAALFDDSPPDIFTDPSTIKDQITPSNPNRKEKLVIDTVRHPNGNSDVEHRNVEGHKSTQENLSQDLSEIQKCSGGGIEDQQEKTIRDQTQPAQPNNDGSHMSSKSKDDENIVRDDPSSKSLQPRKKKRKFSRLV